MHFIGFACEFTVKTTEHTVASYESSDFKRKILTVYAQRRKKFYWPFGCGLHNIKHIWY
jgi:hypothetical protein